MNAKEMLTGIVNECQVLRSEVDQGIAAVDLKDGAMLTTIRYKLIYLRDRAIRRARRWYPSEDSDYRKAALRG